MAETPVIADSGGAIGADANANGTAAARAARIEPRVWAVGALCHAIADTLEARFNPVTVRGEITGFSRAASGHCYFSLKDESGQIRCAMFRRAASLLGFMPRDGELVEVRGKLGVYEQRGDLQLIVESMQRAGQGALFEQFLRLKAQLEAEGLFDNARKRPVPLMPRGIGIVTSLGAAALHDVVSALQRRVPHIPVWIAPASVQGAGAPQALSSALSKLYLQTQQIRRPGADNTNVIDVILLVRGGGSMEDLWAFNDAQLARTIAASPVPVISGVGHETDFTIADFVADLRAPTPTAAAELCATERSTLQGIVELMQTRLQDAVHSAIDSRAQRLDQASARLGRPSDMAQRQRLQLQSLAHRMRHAALSQLQQTMQQIRRREADFPNHFTIYVQRNQASLNQTERSLALLNPQQVLERGYAVLQDASGKVVKSSRALQPGQPLQATLADGRVGLTVQ